MTDNEQHIMIDSIIGVILWVAMLVFLVLVLPEIVQYLIVKE